jgi:hypothetical protein
VVFKGLAVVIEAHQFTQDHLTLSELVSTIHFPDVDKGRRAGFTSADEAAEKLTSDNSVVIMSSSGDIMRGITEEVGEGAPKM